MNEPQWKLLQVGEEVIPTDQFFDTMSRCWKKRTTDGAFLYTQKMQDEGAFYLHCRKRDRIWMYEGDEERSTIEVSLEQGGAISIAQAENFIDFDRKDAKALSDAIMEVAES